MVGEIISGPGTGAPGIVPHLTRFFGFGLGRASAVMMRIFKTFNKIDVATTTAY